MTVMTTLLDVCREVMNDASLRPKYPKGMTAVDVLEEIRARDPEAFPLCTWLDVHDEMSAFYGRP